MPLHWQEWGDGKSKEYIAEAWPNPRRYRRLTGETVTVAVAADGIRIYDRPVGMTCMGDKNLLVSILKKSISLAELSPLFRDAQVAQEVLDMFNQINLEARLAGVDKTWRRIVMPDGGLALGRTLAHNSPQYPYRYLPIAVCIRSNGICMFRQPFERQTPPRAKDMFLQISPCHIAPEYLQELFPIMIAAEITAAYRFNRAQLLRLVCRPAAEGTDGLLGAS